MSRIAGLLALVVLLATAPPATVAHAESGISVTGSSARVNFPTGVTFTLTAESASAISDVTLLLNTPNLRYGAYTRSVRPDFQPGEHITATHTWRRYGSALPPGAEVSYQWRLTDAAGQALETQPAIVRVDDSRFEWQELREGLVTVRWYRGDGEFGREVLDTTVEAVSRLSADQGVDLASPVTVHVYGTQNELRSALPGLPAWVGGISMGEWDSLMVPISPRELSTGRKALVHELTHQLIYQMTFNTSIGSRVPAWLNEGLAVVSEGPTSRENRQTLDQAIDRGRLPTLRSLANAFSRLDNPQAQLAYSAAESVVRFLLETEGAERMRALLAEFREGRTADDALQRVYGRGVDQTEDGWRRSLGLRPLNRGQGEDGAPAPAPPAPAAAGTNRWLLFGSMAALCLTLAGATAAWVVLLRRRT
jgi:hypothetical protein